MTHPSRRRSVKCISWPGLAHPNLNSLSRSLFPHLRASVTLRHACSSSSLQPPQLLLAPLPSGLAHFLRSPLRRRPTKSSRVSVVLMMKRRRKVAHYTFDVDSRGKSHRDVTGRARRARKKCARPAEGKKARVRDFRCARFARFRAKERHAAFVSIIILSTPRSLSIPSYLFHPFSLSPSWGNLLLSR